MNTEKKARAQKQVDGTKVSGYVMFIEKPEHLYHIGIN
jgi:hypothetical protein